MIPRVILLMLYTMSWIWSLTTLGYQSNQSHSTVYNTKQGMSRGTTYIQILSYTASTLGLARNNIHWMCFWFDSSLKCY